MSWLSSDWAEECERLEAIVTDQEARIHTQEVVQRELRTALEDALAAIDFARTEGFEWPTDPYTPAILKVCPPIRLSEEEERNHE